MIKNFEEFKSLNEQRYIDYMTELVELNKDCVEDTYELVREMGGSIKLKKPIECYFFKSNDKIDYENICVKTITSFEIDDDENVVKNSPEGILYIFEDGYLVAITDRDERIPIDHWTCPDITYYDINSELNYMIGRY